MTRTIKSKKMWRSRALIAILVLALAVPVYLAAQTGRGTLSIVIDDQSGAVIPNASLTLTESNTASTYKGTSNADGRYVFPELAPGTYELVIEAQGFKGFRQNGITVTVGSTAVLPVALIPGSTAQTVTVYSDASQLQTESSDVGTTISSELIDNLPLEYNGTIRNPLQFLVLTPGYSGNVSNSSITLQGFKINGGQQSGADIILDGSSVEMASDNLQIPYAFSVEAVQEFKVMSNTFDASIGRSNGGVVNLSSKSGSNDLHGTAYGLVRNAALDANNWLNDYDGLPKAVDSQLDYGAQIAGPVYLPKVYNGKNKTFFLYNLERYRYVTGGSSLVSVPSPAMLNGDFSAILNPITVNGVTYPASQLYDYTTCTGSYQGQPCQPYAGNIITQPADPVFKAASAYFPKPTVNVNSPYNNFIAYSSVVNTANESSARVDQNIGAKQKLFGAYYYGSTNFAANYSNFPLGDATNPMLTQYIRLGYDYVFTPSLLNHFNAGYSRYHRGEISPGAFGDYATKLGMAGIMNTTFPCFNDYYPNGFGTPGCGDSYFTNNSFDYSDTVSWLRGRHAFRFGGEARMQQFDVDIKTYTAGDFYFGTGPTATPSDPNSGFGLASFYRGAVTSGFINLPLTPGFRAKYFAGFVQDDWKVTPKLTLNLGLRYDFSNPVKERHERLSQIDETLPNAAAGGLPGALVFEGNGPGRNGKSSIQSPYDKAFGPRVGLALQVDPKTVVRAGYGIYYTTMKATGYGQQDSAGFFSVYNFPTPASPQTPAAILSQIQKYPGVIPPDVDPTIENGQNPMFILSKVVRPGTIQTWTLDIQRQLPGKTLLDVAYVGDIGTHIQSMLHDPNQGYPANMARGACLEVNIAQQAANPACAGQPAVAPPYPGFSGTVSQALRPFPQFSGANIQSTLSSNPFGAYTYEGLQVQLEKRASNGLTVLATYAWSKNITNSDAVYAGELNYEANGVYGALNTYNLKAEKALSSFDTPQRLVLSYTYELPTGRGKKYLNQGKIVNALVGGWQVGGVQTYQSGYPLATVSPNWDSGIFAGAIGGPARPNVVPGVDQNGYHGKFVYGISRRLNPTAFVPAPNFTFGNAPKVLKLREFPTLDEDFNVAKHVPIFTERVHAVMRMEFFDIFNRHRFTGFNVNAGTPGFGQASQAVNNRTIQGSLRFNF